MFYDDYRKTESEKIVYRSIIGLSKNNLYISIQELDCLGIARNELNDILSKFWKYGLFTHVISHDDSVPLIFSTR